MQHIYIQTTTIEGPMTHASELLSLRIQFCNSQ